MQKMSLPEKCKGYLKTELLGVWEEIRSPEDTRALQEMIAAMNEMLKEYKQGLVLLEQLIQEAAAGIPRALIAEAVDLVVYVERCGAGQRVSQVATVVGCENDGYVLVSG